MNTIILTEKHKPQKSWFYVWPILSTLFFVIYWTFNITYFSYIGLLVYFVPLLFLNTYKCFQIYYFLLPNISLFKLNQDSFALSSAFSLLVLFKLLMEKKFRVNPVTIILLISYFLSSILTYIFAENNLGIMTQEVRVIVDILIVISIIQILEENSEKFFMDISNAFIIGCVVTCISGIFYPINQNIKLEGYRLEAINSDPNYFSLCMAFSISLLLLKIYNNGTKKTDLVIMLILTLSGLMSLSRGYIISMIINVLFFVYLYLFSFKISVLKRIAIIGFLILLIIVMNDYLSNLYSNLLNRTFSEETKGGSGRIDIWSFYLNKTFSTIKNVFFGLGTPNEKLFNSDSFSVQHNIYLELLSGKGVIGTVIVISIYVHVYKIIKKYIKTIKNNIIAFIPLTTLGIGFMFLNGIVSDIGIMTIFLGFLSLKINSMKL